jgi:hypothetical protein
MTMAGDWIKMNKSLPRDPRVIRIASALNADRLRTVGGLFSAWCLFDEQTQDGRLEAYTPELLDELVSMPGIARAMESVGWLEIGDGFLAVPRFGEHNGNPAKRRAQESDRKRSARNADKCPHEMRTESGPEKRRVREEDNPLLFPQETAPHESGRFLPKGWRHMTREVRKRRRVESNSPSMVTIGSFFGRLPETLWTVAEAVALFDVSPKPDEVAILARYYQETFPKESDYRRRDLITLLNNWQTEVDRAQSHYSTPAA